MNYGKAFVPSMFLFSVWYTLYVYMMFAVCLASEKEQIWLARKKLCKEKSWYDVEIMEKNTQNQLG